jgi:4-hydroxy-4-methyl-2-oxoglutarate aldolase
VKTAPDAVAAALREHGAATVLEAAGGNAAWLRGLRPVFAPTSLAGPAYTVSAHPGDNLALHLALADCPPGVVLVVATGGTTETAIWGDVMTIAAQQRGVAGLVTDGAVRDVARIRGLAFPVFAAGTTPAGPVKQDPGELAVQVDLAGVRITPGDWVVGDEDGVVALPAAELEETLSRAEERSRREAELMRRLEHGELTVDLLGLVGRSTDHGMTAAERSSYSDRGYVIRPAVLTDRELAELRGTIEDACARIVEQAAAKGKEKVFGGAVAFTEIPELGIRNLVWEGANLDVVKVVEPVTQVDERLRALWEHPAIAGLARTALGVDEVAPFTDKFNAKRARAGGEFLWHQDHPFWYSIIRGQAKETVTLGLFLDDATETNGALVVVPGSHHGPLPRKKDATDVMVRYHADEARINDSEAVVAEVPAGGVLMFGPFLLHRSGANTTDRDRRVLLLTYQPAGRPPLADFDYDAALLSEQWMDELP